MEEHLPTGWGNWAEISLALLTGFTVFGEVFRRYLNGRITTHTAAIDRKIDSAKSDLSSKLTTTAAQAENKVTAASTELHKKLARERSELEGIIARERAELDEEMSDLRNDLSDKIRAEGAAVGEGLAAIREHSRQIELWVRDNLTRDVDFKLAMAEQKTSMSDVSMKLDRLVERLLDKTSGKD